MLFSFGRDVNIHWKHGINALAADEQDGTGRISIVLWGLCKDVIEEKGSPPMLTDNTRGNGHHMHNKGSTQQHSEHQLSRPCRENEFRSDDYRSADSYQKQYHKESSFRPTHNEDFDDRRRRDTFRDDRHREDDANRYDYRRRDEDHRSEYDRRREADYQRNPSDPYASEHKNQSHKNDSRHKEKCYDFSRGVCKYGDRCRYSHSSN
jgi:hypothetical protein